MELFTSMAVVLGLGACDSSTDYCPDMVGKAAIELEVAAYDNHSLSLEAVHYSDPGQYDRGTEFYLMQYRYRINF